MKILILANNLKWKSWDKKIKELKDWWLPEIKLDITLEQVNFKNIPFVDYPNFGGNVYKGIDQNWFDLNISYPSLKRGFDCVMFCVDEKDWNDHRVEGWNTHNNYGIHEIQILSRENARYNFNGVVYDGDQWFNIARHELSHAIYKSHGIQDNTHYWWERGNLAEVKKELKHGFVENWLVNMWRKITGIPVGKQYRYFNQNEIEGLKPELVDMLDEARHKAQTPFVLTSTLRSPEKNIEVGGVENSAHTKGLAVDIRVRNSSERFKILKALIEVGFTRLGVAKTFIHADIDKTKPQEVIWDY